MFHYYRHHLHHDHQPNEEWVSFCLNLFNHQRTIQILVYPCFWAVFRFVVLHLFSVDEDFQEDLVTTLYGVGGDSTKNGSTFIDIYITLLEWFGKEKMMRNERMSLFKWNQIMGINVSNENEIITNKRALSPLHVHSVIHFTSANKVDND